MKYFLIFMIFLPNLILANYNYQNSNKGKIDMHGGKMDSLSSKNKGFSNSGFSLSNMKPQKNINKDKNNKYKKTKKVQTPITK